MKIVVLNREDVESLLPMSTCIGLMREAMSLEARGLARQPVRTRLEIPQSANLMTMMPGYVQSPDALGIKVVTVFPGNFGTAFGSHQGMILMFDPQTGAPTGLVDGGAVTAIRTAAATAVATDALARTDARSLAILGYGEQARSHLESLVQVRVFEEVWVWGRNPHKAAAFADEMSAELGRPIRPARTAEMACAADVVTSVTASAEPVILGRWLSPGQHINLVGSSVPSNAEIDDDGVACGRLFGDAVQGVRELGAEYRRALACGAIGEAHLLGTVGDVLLGKTAGRRDERDITIFKSLGMAAEDMVTARFLLSEARRTGRGQSLDW